MKFRELAEKIKSGEVVIDLAGHRLADAKQRLIDRYEEEVKMSQGSNDGKWTLSSTDRSMEQVNADMRKHFERSLDMEIKENERFYDHQEHECKGCGQQLKWILTGNVLKPRGYYNRKLNEFESHPFDYVCPFAAPTPYGGQITVTTQLVFANIFRQVPDMPKSRAQIEDWSLCNIAGRRNICAYKAKKNVACGQMTNTSVGIYISDDKKSIIVGDLYIFDHRCEGMTDAQYKRAKKNPELKKIDGHTMVGQVSCEVWRWEATDLSLIKNMKKFKEDHQYTKYVILEVPTGVWKFEHYYDTKTCPDEEKAIYARLTHTS
jgi:hypothetical protein